MSNRRVLSTFLVSLALSAAACGGSSSQPTQGTSTQPTQGSSASTGSSPTSGAAGSPSGAASCTIPQNNGGDHDADNNGGPDDGDGCDK
ncbi:MAG: hypothetical protein QOI76_1096 [Frankiales bacterium]|nr:hypothetical protein [Frankiales bacterium]